MEFKVENNILQVHLNGRIDTSNAENVGNKINEIRQANPEGSLVLDAEHLEYISSAGLRQILKLKKQEKDLKIINVCSEVYEIFDMTGFAEMIDIEKAYRNISVDDCEVIGEGSNGRVYRINDDTIVKVYKNDDALEDIQRERDLAKAALVMGVNTAIPYDVVKVGEHFGSMFELVNSKSITKWLKAYPEEKDKYIKVFADMLKEVHDTPVKKGTLPSEKQVAINWVNYLKGHIDDEHFNKLYKLVDDVPESDFLIHGDYHTNNVHYDGKEAILIDMDTIAVGDSIFEFGCIYNAYIGYGLDDPDKIEKFMKVDVNTAKEIWTKTCQMYFGVEDITDIEDKAKIIGLTRVLRRTIKREPENVGLIEKSRKLLLEAIDKVDTLTL